MASAGGRVFGPRRQGIIGRTIVENNRGVGSGFDALNGLLVLRSPAKKCSAGFSPVMRPCELREWNGDQG
jgi:hypothetical protein